MFSGKAEREKKINRELTSSRKEGLCWCVTPLHVVIYFFGFFNVKSNSLYMQPELIPVFAALSNNVYFYSPKMGY